MAITNTWSIDKLDRITADGYVHTAHFTLLTEDTPYKAAVSGKIDLDKPDTLVPYSDLTEELVVEWVKTKLNSPEINTSTSQLEESLAVNIAEQKAPTRASGVPW